MSKELKYAMDKRNMRKLSCSVVNVPDVQEKLSKMLLKQASMNNNNIKNHRERKVSFSDASEKNLSDAESVGSSYYSDVEDDPEYVDVTSNDVIYNDDVNNVNVTSNDCCASRRSKSSRSRKISIPDRSCSEKSDRSCGYPSSLNVPSLSSGKSSNHSSLFEAESTRSKVSSPTVSKNVRCSKSLGNGSLEDTRMKVKLKHLPKSKSNVDAYYRKSERPSTSSSANKLSSGSNETLASRRTRVNSRGDSQEVRSDYLPHYERTFYNHQLIKEGFQMKLDKNKQEAFKIWFKCVEYQYLSGKSKADKKNVIVKRFVKKDGVFRQSMAERNRLVHAGITHVKQSAFEVFRPDFEQYVNSSAYKNMRKYCMK